MPSGRNSTLSVAPASIFVVTGTPGKWRASTRSMSRKSSVSTGLSFGGRKSGRRDLDRRVVDDAPQLGQERLRVLARQQAHVELGLRRARDDVVL